MARGETVAKEREELTASFREVEGALKEARLLSVRMDQLSERVSQKRHALYARELFARSASVLDPSFWSDAFRAPRRAAPGNFLYEIWRDERGDARRLAAAALILLTLPRSWQRRAVVSRVSLRHPGRRARPRLPPRYGC
jgi:hypothetical protein